MPLHLKSRQLFTMEIGYIVKPATVDMTEWEIVKEVAKIRDPDLFLQGLGAFFAHALQKLYVVIEKISHPFA